MYNNRVDIVLLRDIGREDIIKLQEELFREFVAKANETLKHDRMRYLVTVRMTIPSNSLSALLHTQSMRSECDIEFADIFRGYWADIEIYPAEMINGICKIFKLNGNYAKETIPIITVDRSILGITGTLRTEVNKICMNINGDYFESLYERYQILLPHMEKVRVRELGEMRYYALLPLQNMSNTIEEADTEETMDTGH